MILVSACLYGMPCRYDGELRGIPDLRDELSGEALLIACPEQMGGLSTPRPAAELRGGDGRDVLRGAARVVRIETGEDVTPAFCAGAGRVVALCRECGVTRALLKSKSPSCGAGRIYRDGCLSDGVGVTTAALMDAGISVAEY